MNRKASLIIPCHNQIIYTKMCLQSIKKYTFYPYELIVINNGSTDGTGKWLAHLSKNTNLKIITNSKNMGAPKSFNQGIACSKGNYIVLLNNDIIVSSGWLKKMVLRAENNDEIGIIGPLSNKVKNDTGLFPDYPGFRSFREIQHKAAEVDLRYKDKYIYTRSVASFCMLIKNCVIDKIGILDENYGFGTNDDHDYCFRASSAGYKIAVAMDTLIFHFTNKTLGKMDIHNLDRRNREYFIWKFREAGLEYFEKIKQPYGSRGERPVEYIMNMRNFNNDDIAGSKN